jgi:hypothetical protein|tara:strand:+ start:2589 stop:3017 length:429 start_codon:yes stop_codon:yes gene_type:complete
MNWKKANALIEQCENVVRLPTAAPRQVKNNTSVAQRGPKRELREETAHLFDYQFPSTREAEKIVGTLQSLQRSPELVLLEEILNRLPVEQRKDIAESLNLRKIAGGCQAIEQAAAIAHCKALNVGQKNDIDRAFKRFDENRT